MKNIVLFICTVAMLLTCAAVTAQVTVNGSCTDVTIDGSTIPPFDQDLYNVNNLQSPCSAIVGNPGWTMNAQMYLQQLNSNGEFVDVYTYPQYPPNNTWSNLAHGTYRVKVSLPRAIVASNCESGWVNCYNLAGQYVGRRGNYPEIEDGATPSVFFSNAVPVGNTVISDNSYTFTESVPDNPPTPFTMDEGEVIGLDASASKNYNFWWLAIFESGPTHNRYKANGWTDGTVGQFNLTDLWFPFKFEPFHTYTTQFVVENKQCLNPTNWNVLNQNFFICPSGSGCRFGEVEREITIGPNPAGSFVRLGNFDPALDTGYDMVFSNLSGKAVKSVRLDSDQVDISELASGMYVVNVLRDGDLVFSAKLVVNN